MRPESLLKKDELHRGSKWERQPYTEDVGERSLPWLLSLLKQNGDEVLLTRKLSSSLLGIWNHQRLFFSLKQNLEQS